MLSHDLYLYLPFEKFFKLPVGISVVRELKKGRQKVQFGDSATGGAIIDDEDGTKNPSQPPSIKQVSETSTVGFFLEMFL